MLSWGYDMEGNEMKKWRDEHGLTQRNLADLLGVDPITISRWERTEQKPPGYLLDLSLEALERRLAVERQAGDVTAGGNR